MIADSAIPWRTARHPGWRPRARPAVPAPMVAPTAPATWARFWDDQQAVRLKVILIIVGLLIVALLETPR